MKGKKVLIVLAVCALALAVFATTATAQTDELEFKGTLQGEIWFEWDDPPGPMPVFTHSEAAGTAGPLGRITVVSVHDTPMGDYFGPGVTTFTFRNGDTITADYEGFSHFVPGDRPTLQRGVSTFDITDGTGKFEGATGAGYMVFELHYPGLRGLGPDADPWKAKWTFEGYIILADD